jgi:hypothetical protein
MITQDNKPLVQQRTVGESLIASLLQFSPEDRLSAFAEPRPCEPPYLMVRPVNLLAGRDHIVLRQTNTDYVSPKELTDLADSVTELFAGEGLQLLVGKDLSRWFLKPTTIEGAEFLNLKASDSQQALGRNIDAYMTTGNSARRWRRLETEIQMTWFEHPVNTALLARGQFELNSVWIEGSLSAVPSKPSWLTSMHSNRDEIQQLCNAWKLDSSDPLNVKTADSEITGQLIIIDDWQSRLVGDAMAWLGAWEAFLDPNRKQFQWLLESNATWVLAGEESLLIATPKVSSFKARIKRWFFPSNIAAAEKALMLT